jgi:hypothetical protein
VPERQRSGDIFGISSKPQPRANPTIAGHVFLARMRAWSEATAFLPTSTSPRSSMRKVTLVVITAVGGRPLCEILTSPFWTAMAETPSIPASTAAAAFGLTTQSEETNDVRASGEDAENRG